jgi:hypothetical protein
VKLTKIWLSETGEGSQCKVGRIEDRNERCVIMIYYDLLLAEVHKSVASINKLPQIPHP